MFVVGSPVLTCYAYTCTIINLLQCLIDPRLSLKVLSAACDILLHYTFYIPLGMWITFSGADKKKILSFYLCAWFGIVGEFGGGFPVTLLGILRVTCTFEFSGYGGGKKGDGILLSESYLLVTQQTKETYQM